jgi:hypothetical protein
MDQYIFMIVVVIGGFLFTAYTRWDYRRKIRSGAKKDRDA